MWTKAELAKLVRAAAKYEGTVDYQPGAEFVNIDTPPGKIWAANGGHTIVADGGHAHLHVFAKKWRADALADALNQIEHGVYDCDTPDCDVCEEAYECC